jgi:hypothetical protein
MNITIDRIGIWEFYEVLTEFLRDAAQERAGVVDKSRRYWGERVFD